MSKTVTSLPSGNGRASYETEDFGDFRLFGDGAGRGLPEQSGINKRLLRLGTREREHEHRATSNCVRRRQHPTQRGRRARCCALVLVCCKVARLRCAQAKSIKEHRRAGLGNCGARTGVGCSSYIPLLVAGAGVGYSVWSDRGYKLVGMGLGRSSAGSSEGSSNRKRSAQASRGLWFVHWREW